MAIRYLVDYVGICHLHIIMRSLGHSGGSGASHELLDLIVGVFGFDDLSRCSSSLNAIRSRKAFSPYHEYNCILLSHGIVKALQISGRAVLSPDDGRAVSSL